jgi:hypothetical protein
MLIERSGDKVKSPNHIGYDLISLGGTPARRAHVPVVHSTGDGVVRCIKALCAAFDRQTNLCGWTIFWGSSGRSAVGPAHVNKIEMRQWEVRSHARKVLE